MLNVIYMGMCVAFIAEDQDKLNKFQKAIKDAGYRPHTYDSQGAILELFVPSNGFVNCYGKRAVWGDAIEWMKECAYRVIEQYYRKDIFH